MNELIKIKSNLPCQRREDQKINKSKEGIILKIGQIHSKNKLSTGMKKGN